MAKQNTRDALQAKKEADRIFSEKQQLKAQKVKEDGRKLQDFNVTQMVTFKLPTHHYKNEPALTCLTFIFQMQAEKSARHQQLRREEHEFEAKNAEFTAEEEKQFQQYSQHIVSAAAEAQRNVFPLCKAAREGIGSGLGPISSGVRPSYLVQDRTGAQMPKYVSGATENIKKLHEAVDIQDAKRRLGFTW